MDRWQQCTADFVLDILSVAKLGPEGIAWQRCQSRSMPKAVQSHADFLLVDRNMHRDKQIVMEASPVLRIFWLQDTFLKLYSR